MSVISEIQAPVKPYLNEFEIRFKQALQTRIPLLSRITAYVIKSKGKQMRPLFIMLSANVFGKITDTTYTAATLIELLHTATLMHDDVVDDAHMRRGFFSVNALWKNKYAVLVGDFMLSKGMLISLEKKEYGLLEIVSDAVREISEGELLQLEKARRLDISEDLYFEVIRKKTASLFAACMASGAYSAGADEATIAKMKKIGETIGIAFQLKDDLFDYDKDNTSGKPATLDIKDQKMTLPLIYMLNNCSYLEKRKYIYAIKNKNTEQQVVSRIIADVYASGGIDHAKKVMQQYIDHAFVMMQDLPESPSLEALKKLITYTIERTK